MRGLGPFLFMMGLFTHLLGAANLGITQPLGNVFLVGIDYAIMLSIGLIFLDLLVLVFNTLRKAQPNKKIW